DRPRAVAHGRRRHGAAAGDPLGHVGGGEGARPRGRDGRRRARAGRRSHRGGGGSLRRRQGARRRASRDRRRPHRPEPAVNAGPKILRREWTTLEGWRDTRSGMWAWLIQRAAAILLLVVIAAHLVNPFRRGVQAALLAQALLHALLGGRALLLDFGLEWTGGERRGRPNVNGYVVNNYRVRATNMRLLVESLDANGKTVDTTSGSVADVPPGSRVYFEVPVKQKAPRYRVTITGW